MRGCGLRIGALVGLGLLLAGAMAAYAATNTVPSTRLGSDTRAINANVLKPPECASLNLTNIVTGSGTVNGTNANDLVLGSAGIDDMTGRGGADCLIGGSGADTLTGSNGVDILLGGDGNDSLLGSGGNDVLYGEAGNDTLNGGNGTDICDGGPGTDTAINCETQVNIP
jgi:Ca2+-binding RTX toxin-like protein